MALSIKSNQATGPRGTRAQGLRPNAGKAWSGQPNLLSQSRKAGCAKCGFATGALAFSADRCLRFAGFPANFQTNRLHLRGFQQTLRALNGKCAVDSLRAKERIGPMTKNELIAAVANKAQMTKTAAASAVDATFDAITATLKKGGEVKIMGFGNFRVVKRAAREGRDPRTGAPVRIKAAKRPRFSAGKGLKDAVNR
jgi:DNA-binding protein HU-beta